MEDDISNLTWDDAEEAPETENQDSAPAATEPETTPEPPEHKVPAPVKSYYSDMESAARGESGKSMSKVLEEARAAETRAREAQQQKKRNILYVGLSVLLLLLGVGVVGFFVFQKDTRTVALEQIEQVPSLLPSDDQVYVDISGASSFKIASLLNDTLSEQKQKNQQVVWLSFIEEKSLGFSFTELPALLEALKIEVPISLTQSLTQNFMYGTYTKNETVRPFLALQLSSFNGAFQGMRGWEETMLDDFRGLFQLDENRLTTEAFATAFKDTVIQNKNVRVLSIPTIVEQTEIVSTSLIEENFAAVFENQITEEETEEQPTQPEPAYTTQIVEVPGPEEPVLMYSFLDEQTVLITTHEDVIFEILDRLATQQIYN